MASREAMNMGSRTSYVISDLKSGISGMRQETSLLKQEWNNLLNVATQISEKVKNWMGIGGGTTSSSSYNLVAPNPVFNAPPITGMNENSIAYGPGETVVSGGFSSASKGVSNLTQYVTQNPKSGTLYQPVVSSGGALIGGGGFGGGGGGGYVGGGTPDPNNPNYDPTSSYYTTGSNTYGYNSSGGTFASKFFQGLSGVPSFAGNALGLALSGVGLVSNMVPSVADTVEAQLLKARAGFFGQGNVAALSSSLGSAGTLSPTDPQLDALRAITAAQSYGLTGGDFVGLMGGIANVSNLMPGVGLEGTTRAIGALQQASSVNMLRGIGIQLRDANGNMTAPDKVIDQIWQKICRDYSQAYGASAKAPTLQEVKIGLQPGNSLDSMLNQYFGGDPILKQMVTNGLIYKAQNSGGSTALEQAKTGGAAISQAGVAATGGTTAAVLSLSTRGAAAANVLSTTADIGAAGFARANQLITDFTNTLGTGLAKAILPLKALSETLLSAAGGAPGNVLTDFSSSFSSLLTGMASGGLVNKNTPYIVGEVGPELFVPATDGVIVPNNQMNGSMGGSNNTYNFTVNVPNANTPEVIAAIKNLVSELEMNKKVSDT
jgi:hypothetical protein